MLFASGAQATSDSDSVELVIGKGNGFYVGNFPSEVHMKIDPFTNKHGRKDIYIPIRWNVKKNVKLTAKMTCRKNDEALCKKLFVIFSHPNELQWFYSWLTIDKTEDEVFKVLDEPLAKKVDNPKWLIKLGAWGSLHYPMEARTHKADLRIKIEVDV